MSSSTQHPVTTLSTLHSILTSLQTSYASSSSHPLDPSSFPSNPTPSSTTATISTLHPFHPRANQGEHDVLPPRSLPRVSTVKIESSKTTSINDDPSLDKSVRRTPAGTSGDMSKEEMLENLRNVRKSLSGLREVWRADQDIRNEIGDQAIADSLPAQPPTGQPTLTTASTTPSTMSSERKKNALIRIMSDYCASESGLLGASRVLSEILNGGHGSRHLACSGGTHKHQDRKRTRTPFVQPKTLTSPLERVVDSASTHTSSHGIDAVLDLQNPDFGMTGDGREHSASFAASMTIVDLNVGIPEGGLECEKGGFGLNKMGVEFVGMEVPDEERKRMEDVLEGRFRSYLDLVNAYRVRRAADPDDLDEFSSDEVSSTDGEVAETLALRAERAFEAFEKEWLDLFAMDKRTKVQKEGGGGGIGWFESMNFVQSEIERLQREGSIFPSSDPSILPSFRVLPPDTPFSNPTFRLLPLDGTLPAPFSSGKVGAPNEFGRWKLVMDDPLIVGRDFFDRLEGEDEKLGSAEVDGGIARLLGYDATSTYEWQDIPNGVKHRYSCPPRSVPGFLVGQIGLSGPEDIIGFAQACRRTLMINDLFQQVVHRAALEKEEPSLGHSSPIQGEDLDAELDALLQDKVSGTVLPVTVQRRARSVVFSFPVHDHGDTTTGTFMITLVLRPSGGSADPSIQVTFSSRPEISEQDHPHLKRRFERALKRTILTAPEMSDVCGWLGAVYRGLMNDIGVDADVKRGWTEVEGGDAAEGSGKRAKLSE